MGLANDSRCFVDRMNEAKLCGVKRLAMKFEFFQEFAVSLSGTAVDRIAQERVAYRGHVHADLMRSAGFEPALNQRRVPLEGTSRFQCVTARFPRSLSTIAIFFRLLEERARVRRLCPHSSWGRL